MQYFGYLFFAYTIITLAFLAHIMAMVRRQKRLSEQLELLKKAVEDRERKEIGDRR